MSIYCAPLHAVIETISIAINTGMSSCAYPWYESAETCYTTRGRPNKTNSCRLFLSTLTIKEIQRLCTAQV